MRAEILGCEGRLRPGHRRMNDGARKVHANQAEALGGTAGRRLAIRDRIVDRHAVMIATIVRRCHGL